MMQVLTRPAHLGALGGPIETFLDTSFGKQVQDYVISKVQGVVTDNVKSIQFLTAYSDPITYTGKDLANLMSGFKSSADVSGGGGGGLISFIKPTLILDLKGSKKVVAPYGEAKPGEIMRNKVILAGIILGALGFYAAGSFYLGYKKGQRSR